MFLATNVQVIDGDNEVIRWEYVFKKVLATTRYERVLKFDILIS